MPSRYAHRHDRPYDTSAEKPPEPDRLVVVAFDNEFLAFTLRDVLCDLEEEGAIQIGDAVVATRNTIGKVRLHQSIPLLSGRAALGAFGGLMMGFLLLNPLFGAAAGATVGLVSGALGDVGIDDAFMKTLGETLTPGSSALFVVVRKTKPEVLLERLQSFAGRGKILQTTMTAENETILRDLLEKAITHRESETLQS